MKDKVAAAGIPVDIVKGWAMISIIMFHCSADCFPDWVSGLLGQSWNVAVFFVIAGYFLREDRLIAPMSFLKRKIKRLYLPATIIYALAVVLHNVFVHIGWYPLGGVHPATGDSFTIYGLNDITERLAKVLVACSSGELVMGAMWFLYSLLYAFVGLTVMCWTISKVTRTSGHRFGLMTVCVSSLACVSCTFSQIYGFTLSRVNISLTAMALIWWGMIVNAKWKLRLDNGSYAMVAFILFFHCIIMQQGVMVLAHNRYQDLVHLVAGSTSALYLWGFIAVKIQGSIVGRFLAWVGRESLYLMAFHIIGLFLCNSLLEWFGVFTSSSPKGMYTYMLGNHIGLLLVYVAFGTIVPLAIMGAYRRVKKSLLECFIRGSFREL